MLRLTTGVSSAAVDPSRVTQISWRPRAFIYRGFLTHEECDHLVRLVSFLTFLFDLRPVHGSNNRVLFSLCMP